MSIEQKKEEKRESSVYKDDVGGVIVHKISTPLAPKFNDLNRRRKFVSNVRDVKTDEPQVSISIGIDALDEQEKRIQQIVITLPKKKERIEKEKRDEVRRTAGTS